MNNTPRSAAAPEGFGDLLFLAFRAIATGVAFALAFSAVALALALAATSEASAAQAVGLGDAKTGALLLRTAAPGRFVVAPRVETEVAIEVNGIVARTRVTQVFHNPGDEFVEGVYVFPLPEKAAVDHLWMRIGERSIEGRIQEKEAARRAYEQAKNEGRKAALVEQQRPNLFTNAVASIGPNEMVRVTLEYQQALAPDKGEYRLRFPLAVTPRYTPARAPVEAPPDAPKALEAEPLLHPAYARSPGAVNPVDIVVVIDAGVPLERLSSSYHETRIEKEGAHRAIVYLGKEQEEANRDFELVWSLAPAAAPQAAIFRQAVAGTDYALVMVVPPRANDAEKAAFERVPRETILVVDTSGSMEGPSIVQAKSALASALDTLSANDRFNIVEFNSAMRPLNRESLPATASNVREAKEWVGRLRASGGTMMAPAIAFALDSPEIPGFLRQVVFVTDGAVGNEDELFRLIAERLGSARLFTVGIGSAPNGHFMTKAAQFGRGSFTSIGDVREVEEKMARLFEKIQAPVLRDVSLSWADGTAAETFPPKVPDLYEGEPIVVAAAAPSLSATLLVSAMRGNQPWSVALAPSPDVSAPGVGALWARAKIAALMDAQRLGADAAKIRPAVVKVALEHHLVSPYTSLVAIDVTPTAPAGGTKSALVKASLPQGWSAAMGDIPQTDTSLALHLLLGLLSLAAAGMVAVIGRAVPAGGAIPGRSAA